MIDWQARLREVKPEVRAELKRIYEAVLRERQEKTRNECNR